MVLYRTALPLPLPLPLFAMEQEECPSTPLQIYGPNRMDNPQILGTPSPYVDSKTSSDETATTMVGVSSTSSGSRGSKRKRKRGSAQSKPSVCFVCKDNSGESLIICTRKNCSKTYHPACTGHKANFFKNNNTWQCSSHICIECNKASYHTCYTCIYALCEGCNREPGFLHVTGCKGLCESCTERVITIEKNEQGYEKELKHFRDYWISVRKGAKLVEAIDRLKGQHAGKLDHTNNVQVSKTGSSSEHLKVSNFKRRKFSRCSESSVLEGSSSEARIGNEQGVSMICEEEWASKELLDFVRYMKNGDTSALSHFSVKALLLEYIKQNNLRDSHQRTQILCDSRLEKLFGKGCIRHFEMFRYLRTHLLKSDRKAYSIQARSSDTGPSQMGISGIINPLKQIGEMCKNSGHISISKTNMDNCAATAVHLETKDNSNSLEISDAERGVKICKVSEDKSPHTILDCSAIGTQLETGNNSKSLKKADAGERVKLRKMGEHKSQQTSLDCVSVDSHLTTGDFTKVPRKVGAYKKLNMHKKGEHRSKQANLDDYASIDAHNINLLYLRRNFLEDVLEDFDKFHDKIVGSFVRITFESSKKQEKHRLVEVVGIGNAPHPYEAGVKKTNILLEIMNLSKTEMVPIVKLSNQDFSEEECECLRGNMKSGLVKQMTVREVQEKVMVLQKVRAYSLEKEKQLLCSRRDFLSEKGQRKQHKECVKNLQLLEERLRRVQEVPDIHADPDLAPNDKSQEDSSSEDKVQDSDNYTGHTAVILNSEGKNPVSQGEIFSVSNDSFSGERKTSTTALKSGESAVVKCVQDNGDIANGSSERTDGTSCNQDIEVRELVAASALDTGTGNGRNVVGSGSSDASVTASFVSKTEKLWHYHDSSGKIQGPFSMLQLCKWSTTSSFPANMRIWRKTEMQEDPILLIDALNNTFSPLKVTAASEIKMGKITNLPYAGTVPHICQPTLPSTSSPVLLKPMDKQNASGASCTSDSNMSKPMVIQSVHDRPRDHDGIASSNELPFASHLFQASDSNLSRSQQSSTPHSSYQMVIESALNLPNSHASTTSSDDLPLRVDVGTAAGDLFQLSKTDLPSSQQASSPKPFAGDCTVASQSVSHGMDSQCIWRNDTTVSQADGSEKETKSGACLAVGPKVNGETGHHGILTTESPQSVIHGALIDVKGSVNPPAELADVNLINLCESHRLESSGQKTGQDLNLGSESLGWESAPVQNQETRGLSTETMTTSWVTAAEGNKASNQETWHTKNANDGWDEQVRDMISGQNHNNDGNLSGVWGEPAGNTTTWKNHQNEYTVTGYQNRIHQGSDLCDRSSSSWWDRQCDFVAGNQGRSPQRGVCRYYQKGYCKNGDSCHFSHEKGTWRW